MTVALIDDNDDERRPAVIDAELVETPAPRRPIIDATGVARRQTVAVITTAAAHPHTRRALAISLTVCQGFESWTKRAYDGSTFGTYRRAIKAAELAGDREAQADWADRFEKAPGPSATSA